MNRQIRENDRLQRLLARQGVATAMIAESGNFSLSATTRQNQPSRPSSSSWNDPSSPRSSSRPVYASLTPSKSQNREKESQRTAEETIQGSKSQQKTVPPAQKISEANSNSNENTKASSSNASNALKKLNWGALENSLKAQVMLYHSFLRLINISIV